VNTTIQVTLDAELASSLQETSEQEGLNIDDVLADFARQYVREARRKKLQAEFANYQAMHPQLKTQYLGQHVALYNGQVIDDDADALALAQRIRRRFGHIPVLITQVSEQPLREFVIRSPRLVQVI